MPNGEQLRNKLKDAYDDLVDWILLNRTISIVVVVVTIFVGVILLSAFTGANSKEELQEELNQAVMNEKFTDVKHLFVSENPNLKITDDFVKKWMDEYSDKLDINDVPSHTYVEDRGRIFKSYKIVVEPVYIEINVAKPDRILVGNKPIQFNKNASKHRYGPVLPGFYFVEAVRKYPFATINDLQEVDGLKGKTSVSLNLSGAEDQYFVIDTWNIGGSYKGGKFFVNGKPVTPTKDEPGFKKIGPFDYGKKYKIYGEWTYPWGTLRSDTKEIELNALRENKVNLIPVLKGDIRKELTDAINTFAKQYIEAQRKKDSSVIKVKTDNLNVRVPDEDQTFEGELIQTAIDFKRSYVDDMESEDRIYLSASITYTEKLTSEYSTGEEEEMEYEGQFELIYDQKSKKWLIDGKGPSFSIGVDYSEKNPDAVITKYN